MATGWERYLERWTKAGLIDKPAADLVRAYEKDQEKARGLHWPVVITIALSGLLLAAGVLLFVAAHWKNLSPALRFTLVLVLVAVMHIAGAAVANRFRVLSTTLHAVGTICLGAGIFLTAQIFHLQEHWPAGVMLWASGSWVAWMVLRDWPQAALAAILTPAWLAGEWSAATADWAGSGPIAAAGLLILAISYLTAPLPEQTGPVRRALLWIGGITLIPVTALLIQAGGLERVSRMGDMPWRYSIFGWAAAFLLPLGLAWWLRGRRIWWNVCAAVWVAALSFTSAGFRFGVGESHPLLHTVILYVLCAFGAIGMIAWGFQENRRERVNLGITGFALTLLFFYFSTIMDMLGRSASLIGLGLLFLVGGWLLENTRRRLLARIGKGES